jgi:hypothetical protein
MPRGNLSGVDQCLRRNRGGEGGKLHGVSEIGEPLNETLFLLLLVAAMDVVGAEILMHGSVLEHVVDGREDRRGDRLKAEYDGLMARGIGESQARP